MLLDLTRLPEATRPLMELCFVLSPDDPEHHEYVFQYLGVGELALAVSLITAGAASDLRNDQRELLVSALNDAYVDLWAVPGAADAWVTELLTSRGR